jgi:hypothetical protein
MADILQSYIAVAILPGNGVGTDFRTGRICRPYLLFRIIEIIK